ncbi:right-handed parallel beta-helix repeat-containing protein [Halogeometricum limi]|uniref:Pectate lyase superfamily protein n=1 Tax=Halogeometricum limi TaxID=555875 RepID=A0A1I6IKL2_9EURY|nr:right-handed parallel beta-helix repeat-containing protein [Halogeometricum limi]SFR67327.1 Pectate lyase superfamily protein [Halogeometricum limi]
MTEREITRREALAAIVATVVGVVGIAVAFFLPDDDTPPRPGTETPGPSTSTEGPTTEPGPAYEDIRDYGAAVDGKTDDTGAILRAIEAASPGGIVQMPPGTISISGIDTDGKAIRLGPENANLTLRGAGPGSDGTRLVLAEGHEGVHGAITIESKPNESLGTVRFENFAVDGQKGKQGENPGLGIHTEAEGTFVMRDCHVTSWRNAGLKLSGGMDADIRYCRFDNNGLLSNGGHDISPNQSRRPTNTVIKRVLCSNSGGVSIDVGQNNDANLQTVLVERCVLLDSRGSLKISTENNSTTVRHTLMRGDDGTTIPVKVNPTDVSIDDVTLDNVLIDGGGWPGIDFPCPGRLHLNEVAIKNIDQNNQERGRDRGGIYTRKIDFGDSGRVSLHNIGQNDDSIGLNIKEGGGSIAEVVYGGLEDLGITEGVEIQKRTRGAPLEPDVPSEDDVGPRANRPDTPTATESQG